MSDDTKREPCWRCGGWGDIGFLAKPCPECSEQRLRERAATIERLEAEKKAIEESRDTYILASKVAAEGWVRETRSAEAENAKLREALREAHESDAESLRMYRRARDRAEATEAENAELRDALREARIDLALWAMTYPKAAEDTRQIIARIDALIGDSNGQ
jgi:hypothetical protein